MRFLSLFRSTFDTYWYRSALFTILQRFSLVFFGMVSYLVLVRFFKESQIGVWALFLAICTTFEMAKYALLKNGFITFFNSTDDSQEKIEVASSSLVVNTGFTLIFILLILAGRIWVSHYWNAPELRSMLCLYIPIALLLIPFSHFEYLQQANMSFKGIFMSYFVRQGVFFVTVVVFSIWFAKSFSLELLVIFQCVGVLLATVIGWFYSRKYLQIRFCPTTLWIKKLVKYGKFVFGSGVCSNVFGSLDRFMTASYLSSVAVAYYDVAGRINNMIDVPTTAAADVIFPKSARASHEEGPSKVKYLYERMVGILVALIFPVAVVVFIFAEEIIAVIAGRNYVGAASIVRVGMLYAIFRPIQIQASNVLNSINKPRTTFMLNLLVLIFNLIVNYFLIRTQGFIGAAYGTFLSTIFSFIISFYVLRKSIGASLYGIWTNTLEFYKSCLIIIQKYFKLIFLPVVK